MKRDPVGKYKLVGKTPVECPDIREWGRWFEYSNDQRIVGRTEVGDLTISTVFLGLDHNWAFGGPPLLFETMIFRGAKALNYQKRYSTWAEAEEGHAHAITLAERGELEISDDIERDLKTS